MPTGAKRLAVPECVLSLPPPQDVACGAEVCMCREANRAGKSAERSVGSDEPSRLNSIVVVWQGGAVGKQTRKKQRRQEKSQ